MRRNLHSRAFFSGNFFGRPNFFTDREENRKNFVSHGKRGKARRNFFSNSMTTFKITFGECGENPIRFLAYFNISTMMDKINYV